MASHGLREELLGTELHVTKNLSNIYKVHSSGILRVLLNTIVEAHDNVCTCLYSIFEEKSSSAVSSLVITVVVFNPKENESFLYHCQSKQSCLSGQSVEWSSMKTRC